MKNIKIMEIYISKSTNMLVRMCTVGENTDWCNHYGSSSKIKNKTAL